MQRAHVRQELARRQDAILSQVCAGVVSDMNAAREVLVTTMNDTAAAGGVRVRAAGLVLDYGMRLFELLALAQRVAAIEDRLGGDDAIV